MNDGNAMWLYAITRTEAAEDDLGEITGVAGEPIRMVTSAELTAVVGMVPLNEFGELPLRRNMENLDWLAAIARAHDAVVGALLRRGPTVPLRLATVYLDEDRVAALLADRGAEFVATLHVVADRKEWGVKAYGDRRAMAEPATQRPTPSGGKGTAYLLRRRAEMAAREHVEQSAAAHADVIHTALLGMAVDGRRREATDPVLTGTRAWMILNGTYLVDDAHDDEFAALVERLGADHPGVTLELTGPWPPYSFSELSQAAR